MSREFIIVRSDLTVELGDKAPVKGIAVSTMPPSSIYGPDVFVNRRVTSRFGWIVPEMELDRHEEQTGERPVLCPVSPEPWLIALCVLMWEGVVQGLAWDVVKSSVSTALSYMRTQQLLPESSKKASRRLLFKSYLKVGKLFDVFCQLEMTYHQQESARLPSIEQPPANLEYLTRSAKPAKKRTVGKESKAKTKKTPTKKKTPRKPAKKKKKK